MSLGGVCALSVCIFDLVRGCMSLGGVCALSVCIFDLVRKRNWIYIALFRHTSHSGCSGMDHTVLAANYTMPACLTV